MRIGVIVLSFLLLAVSQGMCEQLPYETTGNEWSRMENDGKAQYLAILYDSVVVESGQQNTDVAEPIGHPFIADKALALQKLDEFYADETNLSIPVMTALVVLKAQAEGAGPEEIQVVIEEMNAEIARAKKELSENKQ